MIKPTAIPPAYRELIENVIQATCQYFEVSREDLITEYRLANARYLCYYIIIEATTGIYDYHIGTFFNKKRTSVQYGIELIAAHKNYYRQTLGNLNGIIEIANNLDKKYSWHLQSVNTTH